MTYKINHANIKEWAKNYDGELFDGILCDPPYELGFMGKSWDSSGIAFDTEMWADIYKLLKPGAHLLAFSGSRTYHRMAVAIEDAGFEIRDMIEWVYGSGFPKSLNVAKAIDKANGFDGEVIGKGTSWNRPDSKDGDVARMNVSPGEYDIKELSEEAKYWEGYGTALKPAHEPCVLARKPIEGTVANNVLKHGTGGLNIDGTRVGTFSNTQPSGVTRLGQWASSHDGANRKILPETVEIKQGRFPANLIHDGSDEVEAVFPQTKSGGGNKGNVKNGTGMFGSGKAFDTPTVQGDSGSASRFFYTAKASKSERNAGLEGFEEKIAGGMQGRADGSLAGPIVYNKNVHPTVKPLSLTNYLATLIKPPTGGRLLVPFSGSGSEVIGGLLAGWEYVEGVELTEEYIPIAEARIKYWTSLKEEESKQVSLL